ncbi:type II secretion system F family protein [Colwellia sp. Arc7-D]|jgi:tight adherence protein C|uniref:type II secretion system F family protein n=1 Tax=Colwellia sp. Arc7-D TaxID=2161872 RepID=UPI0013A58F22|nr:type II secretion system F family protein [Colwellia sp. Arc7-D]|tara:strand:+ start:1772 stop:2587 length:816 start_codon:yes stop_codon:yes gene_type:complete
MNMFSTIDIIFLLMLCLSLYLLVQVLKQEKSLIEEPFTHKKKQYLIYPDKLVRQCGIPSARYWLWYWAVKWGSVAVISFLLLEFFNSSLLVSCGAVLAFFLLDISLLLKRNARRNQIKLSLVFFTNLLIVFLKSGLSLSNAFRKAGQFGLHKNNPLAAELELIAYELDAGRDRAEAFDQLSNRTGVDSLNKLAVIIKAGVNVGSPVSDGLQSLADFLRLQQEQQLTSRINRKALESTLPMAMVCFPMFFVLVFFPAGQQISEIMSLLGEIL